MDAHNPDQEARHIQEAVAALQRHTDLVPRIALVLGSGLGAMADRLQEPVRIPYAQIPHFPRSTVPGHAGTLVVGTLHGLPIAAMQGRVHAYEGLSMDEVVRPLRILHALGCRTLVVTNAAGGLNPDFEPGTLMLIRDHINLTGRNPLVGPNNDEAGPRFPDMTDTYTAALAARARAVAAQRGITLREGVYVGVSGPSYETPAEVRAFHRLGGDAVGMSTVPEVIIARHLGMQIVGLSCITNLGAGLSPNPLNHDEVTEVANRVRNTFLDLVDGILESLHDA